MRKKAGASIAVVARSRQHDRTMQLSEYISSKGLSIRGFAVSWGQTRSPMTRIVNGRVYPPFETIVRLYVETGGEVALDDWIELHRDKLVKAGALPKGWKKNG